MRYIAPVLLLLPAFVFAQTKADYEQAMAKFMKYYNHYKGDSIAHMFPSAEWNDEAGMWAPGALQNLHAQFGELKSFSYLGQDNDDPDKVIVFKTVYSKAGNKTTSLTLDKENHFGDFRFITSSPGIDKLLKKEK